jgi:HEAT repeat protein
MKSKSLIAVILCANVLAVECWTHGGVPPITPPVQPPLPGPTPNPAPVPGDPTPVPSTPGPGTPTAPPIPHAPRPLSGGGREGGSKPRTPEKPSTPSNRGPSTGSPATGTAATGMPSPLAATGGAAGPVETDPTSWELWWLFNQDRYLDLKAHIAALDVSTGSDSAWMASGSGNYGADAASEIVVPALLATLEKERQQDIVTAATVALARMADGPVAARSAEFSHAFAAFVNDPNQEIGETSVLARGIVGDESAAQELTALLGDAPSARKAFRGAAVPTRTRAFAAYALGLLASKSANEDVRRFIVHHLANTLHEDMGSTPDVHVGCVLALGLTPLAWTSKLGDGLDAPATPAAARRISTVATASRETQIEALFAVFVDPNGDRFVRAHVPTALAKLSDGASEAACTEITTALLDALAPNSRERDEVVQGCTLALGAVGGVDQRELDVKVRATLERIALGGERQSRSFALIALAQRAARTHSATVAAETRAFLAERLSDGKSHERAWAALALGVLERERKAPNEVNAQSTRALLVSTLKDCGSPEEVGALAIGCGLASDLDAVPVLITKLERTADVRVQGYLAVALGLLGDARATQPLKAVLADARFRPELLRSAAIGLAMLEDRTLVPTLVDTLSTATSLASQGAAASVIGWIGDKRAVDPLLKLLANRDVTASARGYAAVALGRVCDRDRLPWNALIASDVHYRAATVTLLAGDGTGVLEIY